MSHAAFIVKSEYSEEEYNSAEDCSYEKEITELTKLLDSSTTEAYEISSTTSEINEFDKFSSMSTTEDEDDYMNEFSASGDNEIMNETESTTITISFIDSLDGLSSTDTDSSTVLISSTFDDNQEDHDIQFTSITDQDYEITTTEFATESSTITSTDSTEKDSDSSEYSTTQETFPTSSEFKTTTEDEMSDLILKFHFLRIKEVNYTHMIRNQENVIKNYEEQVLSLKQILAEQSKTIEKLNDLNNSFIQCQSQMRFAKRVVKLDKYSKALKKKLGEFESMESLQNSEKTVVKVSNFIVENDNASANILSNYQLLVLPLGIGQMFPNITELSASCGLVAINSEAFEDFEDLKKLNLSGNLITEIESENFVRLKFLQNLDLSDNQISLLNNDSFSGLEELKYLNLGSNNIEDFPKDIFTDLTLEILILSNNRIRHLKYELLSEINLLQEFYCDNNLIESINPKIIMNFETALKLDLSSNICIDESYPLTTSSMVKLALIVSEKCKIK